jgi:hypothetical protein
MSKMKLVLRWLGWFVVVCVIAVIVISLTAGLLGMDDDQKWGPFRIGMLATGVSVLGLIACLWLVDTLDRRILAKRHGRTWVRTERSKAALGDYPLVKKASKWVGLVVFLVGMDLLYVWFVSVGHWTAWPQTTRYYDMLADAFLDGQTGLLVEPPQELASLKYPWPTEMRPGIPVIADASYYMGKYYLYWGPAPAGMAAIWKLISQQRVGDETIVFVAASLILVFSVLIMLDLKQRYYPEIPAWLFGCSLVAVTTVHPLLWNLNRPAIHEASITSGQAFLLAGLFFALPTITGREVQVGRLILAGTMWGLALASRLTLLGAIGTLVLGTLWGLTRTRRRNDQKVYSLGGLVGLTLPIVICLGLLGLYNFVRFNSPLEPGLRYQLSKIDLNRLTETGSLFNPVYLSPNLLYYLITPLRFRETFPFVRPFFGKYSLFSAFLEKRAYPAIHHVEDATGLFMVMPFLFVSAICVGTYIWRWSRHIASDGDQTSSIENIRESGSLLCMSAFLFFATILAFVPVVLYFWVATRFMLDFTPLLMLAATIGIWAAIQINSDYPILRSLLSILIISALVTTVCVSLLLAVTGADSRFDDLNPELWRQMLQLFSP